MDPSKTHLNNLILGVCHLCERTKALANSDERGPFALAPVREAAQMVQATLEALQATWDDAAPAALPQASPETTPAEQPEP